MIIRLEFSHRHRAVEARCTLKVRNIPFINDTEHLSVFFFYKRLHADCTWKCFQQGSLNICSYLLSFQGECLSTNTKLAFLKELIRSIMTYACLSWEFAVDTYL